MNCTGCGAPLATNTLTCSFCGVVNAVDLLAIGDFRVLAEHSAQQCPNQCGNLLQLQLGAGLNLSAGFCPQCKGLQLTAEALAKALTHIGEQVREINLGRLDAILTQRVARETIRYRPCASCNKLMHRRAYNAHIPVIIDDCREHGVWLDGGEFTVLAEWMEAGGLHNAAAQSRRERRLNEPLEHLPSEVLQQVQLATAPTIKAKTEPIRNFGDIPRWIFWLIATLLLLFVSGFNWWVAGFAYLTVMSFLQRKNDA